MGHLPQFLHHPKVTWKSQSREGTRPGHVTTSGPETNVLSILSRAQDQLESIFQMKGGQFLLYVGHVCKEEVWSECVCVCGWQGWLASRNSWNSWWLLGWDWSSACITSPGQLLILGTTPLHSYVQFHLWDLANFTLTIIHPHGPQGTPRASIGC